MVFQKRSDSGSVGYQLPKMPRFPRSARGKRSLTKKVEVNPMRPFDLLATVAGELLAKRDSGYSMFGLDETTCPIKKFIQGQFDNGSPSKSDVFDQGSCDESSFIARFVSHGQFSFNFEEHLSSLEERTAASDLALVNCDVSDKDASAGSLAKNVMEFHNLADPMDLDTKATAQVSSKSCVEITPNGDRYSAGRSSFPSVRNGIELLVDRDDDENSSRRTHSSNMYATAFKPHCIGDSRVRKIMRSSHWKADREVMNDGELWNDDEEIKPVFGSRKLFYTRQRTKRSSFKRRKSLEGRSFSATNGGFSNEGVPDPLLEDCIMLDSTDPRENLSGAHGRSSSTSGHSASCESVENHVKLSIKSFRVPELFIEIPADATVGSLKRTVMEAVTAILSGGLRVGVLHQGKKIGDDNKTILQAGISNMDKSDNLGFTLEPNPKGATSPSKSLFCEPEPLTRFHVPAAPTLGQRTFNAPNPTNSTEGDLNSVQSPTNPSLSVDKMEDNLKALVPVLSATPEPLAVVPLSNPKRSEMVQRRIRRPFSVTEVEALVQAVEILGTGRWRDVKFRSFDSAKHRTYVDLKDKWKTLVHTAKISPQQRRGEPVPQDLLDRVLSAHDYWSRQQAKGTGLVEHCLHPG